MGSIRGEYDDNLTSACWARPLGDHAWPFGFRPTMGSFPSWGWTEFPFEAFKGSAFFPPPAAGSRICFFLICRQRDVHCESPHAQCWWCPICHSRQVLARVEFRLLRLLMPCFRGSSRTGSRYAEQGSRDACACFLPRHKVSIL